ncbi:hypothetical protein M0805_006893 [Coniferiporia weirii]|nr:hypothetical protein M0805_006893 [Coniferiporia weirii]
MSGIVDSDELARFREQWRVEVRLRTSGTAASASTYQVPADATTLLSGSAAGAAEQRELPAYTSPTVATLSNDHAHRAVVSTSASVGLSSALDAYRLAVRHEQSGALDEALKYYRHAFRLDSNVDKAYHREESSLSVAASLGEGSASSRTGRHQHKTSLGVSLPDPSSGLSALSSPSKPARVSRTLANLISSFSHVLEFAPEDEKASVPLRLLPDELLVLILKKLDPVAIERFAVINKKARILSLDSSIWKHLVQKTYVPPQITEELTPETIADRYLYDYRRFYIEHPRLRLDGVYIAICHYNRPGLSENAWIKVNHFITYHRYLRFFPDGTVISLLANEEMEPRTIIPLLGPSLRMKGLFIGTWTLVETTILIQGLTDPSGDNLRYTFRMTLTLRSRPLGRWNKLDFARYDSIDSKSGEATPVALRHERPFWFSKVQSYA